MLEDFQMMEFTNLRYIWGICASYSTLWIAHTHISKEEQKKQEETLSKYEIMFHGKLGQYPHEKFHLNLIEGAKPVSKAHIVLYSQETVFKKELDSLVDNGVLEKCQMVHI